jgi:DNA-binding transcriptional ArsR family regulator
MSSTALKALFSSQARIKLLTAFLLHPEQEYFIRELTRLLDEQINSIRRELENLRKIGLVKARHKNRKKYYHIDTEFIFYNELRSMFLKEMQTDKPIVDSLKRIPGLKLVVLAGVFVGNNSPVDLFVVGDVRKDIIETLLLHDDSLRNAKYSIFSEGDFLYRLSLRDKFVLQIINDPQHITVINALQKQIEEIRY